MKKQIALITILCLISVLFCGCGKGKTGTDGTDSTSVVNSQVNASSLQETSSSEKNTSQESSSSSKNTSSGSASKSSSGASMTQGVDEISVSDAEEGAFVIDAETGKVISAPSKDTSESTVTIDAPSASSSSTSVTSSSSQSSASGSSSVDSSSNDDPERDTMSGFSPLQ